MAEIAAEQSWMLVHVAYIGGTLFWRKRCLLWLPDSLILIQC